MATHLTVVGMLLYELRLKEGMESYKHKRAIVSLTIRVGGPSRLNYGWGHKGRPNHSSEHFATGSTIAGDLWGTGSAL